MKNTDIQYFPENTSGRDFFVGDIHGCYELFMEKLAAVDFNAQTDRVFSVGDLVDRGPESLKCLSLVREPWFYAVWGNHEQMMEDGLRWKPEPVWLLNGGSWVLTEDREALRKQVYGLLPLLAFAIEVESDGKRIGVIHADVTSGVWGQFGPVNDLWSRSRISGGSEGDVQGVDRLVVGHTVVDTVTRIDNVIYIDTGASMGGDMQLLEAQELFSV